MKLPRIPSYATIKVELLPASVSQRWTAHRSKATGLSYRTDQWPPYIEGTDRFSRFFIRSIGDTVSVDLRRLTRKLSRDVPGDLEIVIRPSDVFSWASRRNGETTKRRTLALDQSGTSDAREKYRLAREPPFSRGKKQDDWDLERIVQNFSREPANVLSRVVVPALTPADRASLRAFTCVRHWR